MKRNKKILKRKEKGITLIALVITIIVLLILAGVSIAMLTGDNGILTQAQNASEETEIGKEKEQIALAYNGAVSDKVDQGGSVTDTDMDNQFELNGTKADAEGSSPIMVTFTDTNRSYMIDENGNIIGPLEAPEDTEEPETGGQSFEMSYGVTEIKWLIGSTDYATETANAPVIKTDLEEGTTMKLVHYDGSGNAVEGTDYNYDENRWANAEVDINGVKSYFVWIPRYAYRIVYFDTPEHQEAYREGTSTEGIVGYSDSRGIVDVNGRKVDGVTSTTSTNVGDYFRVHPAFTDEVDNGGWSENLSGIWVGKYESARSNATSSSSGSGTTIKVQPNVQSFRNETIGNLFDYAKAYSPSLNSHMLKNSEWGAVAYLTESKYGRNGTEVTINNSSSYITGSAGNSASAATDVGTTNEYWSEQGVLASSTGNVYGIYDLSGGAFEYVAAYYNGSTSSSLTNNGASFASQGGTSTEYVTAYTGTSESSAYKQGDATYETSSWNGDDAYFVNSDIPFFYRGGGCGSGSFAGEFCFNKHDGNAVGDNSFRMCLTI